MIVYQTDKDGVFVGITKTDVDPKDTSNTLLPAGAVEVQPPSFTDSQFVRWDGSAWGIEDIPSKEVDETPLADPDQDARNERNFLLNQHVDPRMSNPLWWSSLDGTLQADIEQYRLDLLDVPQQFEFPHNITWPQEPST